MSATVLVVDDSLVIRQQVGRALTSAGFAVLEASDGAEALRKLAATPEASLVVCDVNMPRMSGIEFLEVVKRDGLVVPVVMLTTEGEPELVLRAKALGAKCWLVKPLKSELLVAAVKKLIEA